MGSALSAARVMPEQVVQDLHREDQILTERSTTCGCSIQSTRPRTEEERDASIICHVHHALRHYNAHDEGSDFVPVKPLMAAYVGFRGHIWVHVNFTARRRKITSSKQRRNKANDHVKHFFAELRYDHHYGAPTVETCTIIDTSSRHLIKVCAFCPPSFEILHPLDGNFVCGKKSQANEDLGFSHFMNLLEKPFSCPTASREAKEDAATLEEKRSIMNRIALRTFEFCCRFMTEFLWGFDPNLEPRISEEEATQEDDPMKL